MGNLPTLTVSHIGICVADFDRAVRFYTDALGFSLVAVSEGGEPYGTLLELTDLKIKAAFVQRDGLTLEVLGYPSPGVVGTLERRPMNQLGFTHLSLVVEDIDSILERIIEFGGRVYPATRIDSDSGEYVFCTDPDGARIELWRKPL